jgi:hypothetical protein
LKAKLSHQEEEHAEGGELKQLLAGGQRPEELNLQVEGEEVVPDEETQSRHYPEKRR